MADQADARAGRPAGALTGHVGYHGYDLHADPGIHRGLPSPYLTFIVTFGTPLTMRAPDGSLVTRDVAVGGLHTALARITAGHARAEPAGHAWTDDPAARS